jgi:DNA ligase-1
MMLCDIVRTSSAVASVASRRRKIEHLAELFQRMAPDEIEIAIPFLTGDTRQGRLGIGPAAIRGAATTPAENVALTLHEVDETFARIASAAGAGSAAGKAHLLRDLFSRATSEEQRFLVHLLHGELRQGALEGILVEAVARATGIPADRVRRAVMMAGDLAVVARAARAEGDTALDRFAIELLRPVQPMLADSAADVSDALDALGTAALEFKLDGGRIQVHKAGDEVRVFSRHLREVTSAVPEVVDATRAMPVRELILDGEVIALRANGCPYPFQVTMRRFGRKLDVDRLRSELPLTPFFFDLVYRDGQSLIDEPRTRRFDALAEVIPASMLVPNTTVSNAEAAARFFDEALARGHEGIMAKALDAPYAAGSRGSAWLKVKPAHTLDLVVLAAEWGSGRRRGWLSNLHLGARDPERHAFVMLGKTFKGLTDEMLTWQTAECLARELARDEFVVHVRPELVVEIAFNDIQESPRYPGGLALRFARVKRYRTDKSASQADTLATVQDIYRRATGKEPPPRLSLRTS